MKLDEFAFILGQVTGALTCLEIVQELKKKGITDSEIYELRENLVNIAKIFYKQEDIT